MKIPEFIKYAYPRYGIVDLLMLLLIIIVGIFDMFTNVSLKGGYFFFAVYILGMILRMAWWKYQYKNKGKEGFKEIL